MRWIFKPLLGVIFLGLLATYGFFYYNGYFNDVLSSGTSGAVKLTTKLPYKTECEWISTSVATDIVDLLHFAKSKDKAPFAIKTHILDNNSKLQISWNQPGWLSFLPTKITQPISEFIWSPTLYLPFAETQFKANSLQIPGSFTTDSTSNPLETLLNPQVDVLEKENQRISDWLTKEPLNPVAHEEAALLCGVLAMREAAGCFYDARPALNQLAAHLTIAQLVRKGSVACDAGTVANLILEVVSGRERNAESLLQQWKSAAGDDVAKVAWAKALSLRNTGNWTALSKPGAETLLVRLEYLRALAFQVNNSMAIDFCKQDGTLEHMPDIVRVGLSFGPSVEEGHIFSKMAFPLETVEIKHLFETQGETFSPAKIIDFVNADPGTPVCAQAKAETRIRVITPGTWGRFYQRHILHETLAIYYFIDESWGVPEQAVKFKNSLTPLISQFCYYPIVQLRWAKGPQEIKAATLALEVFVQKNIERMADYNAFDVSKKDETTNGLFTSWYKPFEPIGTTYASSFRAYTGEFEDDIVRYHELNPLSPNIAYLWFKKQSHTDPKSFELAKECYGPLLDYNLWAMKTAVDTIKDPVEYETQFNKICVLSPNSYLQLGDYFVNISQPEKAAVAYQKAVDLGRDRVHVANSCRWLVNYYYDQGHKDEALKVAAMAAEVYSYRGLETMMLLQEKMGSFTEAEDYGKKIWERYDDSEPLTELYVRHPELPGHEAFSKQLEEQGKKLYPQGIPKVTLDSFKTPPTDGIRLGPSARLHSLGIEANTIIVALDGIQVHNEDQYTYVRSLNPSPKMDLIVWKQNHYEALTVEQPGRRFGVPIIEYQK